MTHDIRASWRMLLLWLLLAAVVLVVLAEFRVVLASVVAGVSVVLAPLGWFWRTLRGLHRRILDFGARERSIFEPRRAEATNEIVALREELATVDAATRLSAFLTERGDSSGYERFRGLVGQVYRDLRQLDEDLRAARGEQTTSVGPTRSRVAGQPPPLVVGDSVLYDAADTLAHEGF